MSDNLEMDGGALISAGTSLISAGNAVITGGTLIAGAGGVLFSTSTMVTSALVPDWPVAADDGEPYEHVDQMFRFQTDSLTRSVVGHTWETAEFVRGLSAWAMERSDEVDLLKDFAAWQKNKLDYGAVHAAWLLEAMSDEEFEEEASKYVNEIGEQDPRRMADVAEKLVRLLDFELTTSELADFLHAEPRAVLDSIAQYGQQSEKLRALLPSDKQQLLPE